MNLRTVGGLSPEKSSPKYFPLKIGDAF